MIKQKRLLSNHKYFKNYRMDNYIEDDHVPFFQRRVPILHLIPPGFTRVWHTIEDDFDHLSWVAIQDIQTIFLTSLSKIVNNI